MKLILLVLSCLALAAAYDDLDDNYFCKLLDNRAELEALFKCLADQGPCTDFGKHAKAHMVEFYADGCNECDARQKHYGHLFLLILKNDYPELYKVFEAKYDPNRNVDNVVKKLKNV